MRAWVLHGINDLRFEDIDKPILKVGEALLKIQAAGICSSDIPRVFSTGAYYYPIILGHEFSAIVDSVYDDKNEAWVGKRVGIFPLLPCFECESCKLKTYETCSCYSYIGSRQNGAFAEYVAVPIWNLIKLPDTISYEEAALLEPASVSLHAVRKLRTDNVKSVAVVGNGTIGNLIAEWLKIIGIEEVNLIGRNSPDRKVDAVFEAVGTIESLKRSIEMVRPNGQIVLVGNPNSEFLIDQKLYWQILRKQITISGSWNSTFIHDKDDDWNETVRAISGGELNVKQYISHHYKFNNIDKALKMMFDKTEKKQKIMISY
jgi:L-iditol 2-dehydrogenase